MLKLTIAAGEDVAIAISHNTRLSEVLRFVVALHCVADF